MNETNPLFDPLEQLLAILSEEDLIRFHQRAKLHHAWQLADFLAGALSIKKTIHERE
jgi:hypothetical protein